MSGSFCSLRLLFLLRGVLSTQSVTIYGPSFAAPLFEDLRLAFTLSHPYNMSFQSVVQEDVIRQLNQGEPIIVDTLDNLPNSSLVIPMFGFPLVVAYNLAASALYLSQEVLVDIFLGDILWWNDSKLIDLNPNASLPNEPINLLVGALLDRFVEGIVVLADDDSITLANLSTVNTADVGLEVCSEVKARPYSLGFSWMGDAIRANARLALLQNLDGFFASPVLGTPSALSEYHAAQKALGSNVVKYPHNQHGRLTWPIVSVLYVVLPAQFASCSELVVLQHFLSLVMFQTESMDLFAEVLGWEPGRVLTSLDNSLGVISEQFNYVDLLFGIPCGSREEDSKHTIGTSPELWSFVLKMLVPYTGELDGTLQLAPTIADIDVFLTSMLEGRKAAIDIQLSFTWAPVAVSYYPALLSVPVFMGSVVPLVNLGSLSIILSLPLLANIFVGNITHWDDARIAQVNPSVILPTNTKIVVFAAPYDKNNRDSATSLFSSLLSQYIPGFSWSQVNTTVSSEGDIVDLMEFTVNSIGYTFGHLVNDAVKKVPKLVPPPPSSLATSTTNNEQQEQQVVSFTSNALSACWGVRSPFCWPLAIPLVMVVERPTEDTSCLDQQSSVSFIFWVLENTGKLEDFLVPNPNLNNKITVMGEAEFCGGRSLLFTRPEIQQLTTGLRLTAQVLTGIFLLWSVGQGIALAIARNRSELKSASVVFSLLAVVGVFAMLLCPLLIVQDTLTINKCSSAMWFLALGFSLCYGSLFAKLFRLYTIFTSRKLVVPRLSNRRLFWIVLSFLLIDFILLLIYNILTPPEPYFVSGFLPDSQDLVTGQRELVLEICNFHDSVLMWLIMIVKFVVALAGAGMAFFIRQVDRRFSATSALGWAFYNMFLTILIAIVIMLVFKSESDLESDLFIPVFCGLWIVFITLVALTLDSNVLLACQDFSKPLRQLLGPRAPRKHTNSKDHKAGAGAGGKVSTTPEAEAGGGQSRSSTIFVVNREMFPSKYDNFDNELLEKILDELNFQRIAVRRAMISPTTGTGTATVAIELTDLGNRRRGSTKMDTPTRLSSKSKSNLAADVLGHVHGAGSLPTSHHFSQDVSLKVSIDTLLSPEIVEGPINITPEVSDPLQEHKTLLLTESKTETLLS